jgi:hypothetical protein
MREAEVRAALHQTHFKEVCATDPAGRVIDELGIFQGVHIIDVAVVTHQLHGYEIKSAADNLERLQKQQHNYNKVFDRLTLVADERHVEEAVKILPPWWGLIAVCRKQQDDVVLNEIWPARLNFQVEADALCQLLWRDEALSILKERGLAKGLRTRSRRLMWKSLAQNLELNELKAVVCRTLKARKCFRYGQLRSPLG